MIFIFELLFITFFVLASIMWLITAIKRNTGFDNEEKLRTASFTVAYLLAFFLTASSQKTLTAVISLIGFAISEFTVAIVFYDKFKDKDTLYE